VHASVDVMCGSLCASSAITACVAAHGIIEITAASAALVLPCVGGGWLQSCEAHEYTQNALYSRRSLMSLACLMHSCVLFRHSHHSSNSLMHAVQGLLGRQGEGGLQESGYVEQGFCGARGGAFGGEPFQPHNAAGWTDNVRKIAWMRVLDDFDPTVSH